MENTNGNCAITIGDITYPLFFGRLAVEEFAKRTETTKSDNTVKLVVDMVYSGFINYQTRQNFPLSPYEEIYDLCEEFLDQEDWLEQFTKIDECFFGSKYGAKYKERIEVLKKKIEEEMEKVVQAVAEPPQKETQKRSRKRSTG